MSTNIFSLLVIVFRRVSKEEYLSLEMVVLLLGYFVIPWQSCLKDLCVHVTVPSAGLGVATKDGAWSRSILLDDIELYQEIVMTGGTIAVSPLGPSL